MKPKELLLNHLNMKNLILMLSLLVLFSCKKTEKTAEIRVNQLGYYPNAAKKAIIANTKATKFEICTLDKKSLFTGDLSESKDWSVSGEKLKQADFTVFTEPGTYLLLVDDAPESCAFTIKENLYRDAFKAALKNYYYIRASINLDEKYAGKWNRKIGHPDTLCYFHPSANRGEGQMSSPGGWYDAGDCNKYIVNAGVTVGTLLNFFEMYPDFVTDEYSNIPESGNGLSDLLDEVKYELDWVLTMQAPDGASHFKLSSKGFTGFIMPEEDTTSRYVIGKSTAASLNFSAMTAQASRLYKTYNPEFAQQCLDASEKAWNWAFANPNIVFKNPSDIVTGEYGDSTFTEEFWWAAAELYLATSKPGYLEYLTTNEPYVELSIGESWRKFIGNLGSFSLLLNENKVPAELIEKIKSNLLSLANQLIIKMNMIPYHIAIDEFVWGSNSDIQNSAIVFAYAYKISNDKQYLDAIVETMDYIFGKNATGFSFMTGFGSKTPMNIHNRPSAADGIDEPVPGFIAGGPNNKREDDISKSEWGVEYPIKFPAKSYVDLQGSYASNETCINWNAPAVFVLGFLEANADKLK